MAESFFEALGGTFMQPLPSQGLQQQQQQQQQQHQAINGGERDGITEGDIDDDNTLAMGNVMPLSQLYQLAPLAQQMSGNMMSSVHPHAFAHGLGQGSVFLTVPQTQLPTPSQAVGPDGTSTPLTAAAAMQAAMNVDVPSLEQAEEQFDKLLDDLIVHGLC